MITKTNTNKQLDSILEALIENVVLTRTTPSLQIASYDVIYNKDKLIRASALLFLFLSHHYKFL